MELADHSLSGVPPTLGILGAGQLARMTAIAAIRMGLNVRLLTADASGPEAAFAGVTVADWHNPEILRDFASTCDVVTVESEWAPADTLATVLPDHVDLLPFSETLLLVRHKGRQKKALRKAGLPLPPFALCETLEDAIAAATDFGFPVVMKRYEGSYDGYGNATCDDERGLSDAWEHLAGEDGALVEAWVPFVEELAVQVARRVDGEAVVYPVAVTEQLDHRCHSVAVPSGLPESVELEAQRIALAAVETVGAVGIAAVELFRLADGRVLVNELAPRPHNTGHYTIEASHTSQFENHVRAVMGWPLGSPALRVPAACMVNVLGHRSGAARSDALKGALSVSGATIHIYAKKDVRLRRKMGHVTLTGDDPEEIREAAEAAASQIQL